MCVVLFGVVDNKALPGRHDVPGQMRWRVVQDHQIDSPSRYLLQSTEEPESQFKAIRGRRILRPREQHSKIEIALAMSAPARDAAKQIRGGQSFYLFNVACNCVGQTGVCHEINLKAF